VTYNVYLGEDNYGNFDTERNCEYYHNVTIRGILNSDAKLSSILTSRCAHCVSARTLIIPAICPRLRLR
jgi:hypothetical protein